MTDTIREKWKGRRVKFLLRDIHHPAPLEVLDELYGGDPLHGRGDDPLVGVVIDVSDNRTKDGAFVVIRCDRVRARCVLAVERVQPID